jgi:hypothetical protein
LLSSRVTRASSALYVVVTTGVAVAIHQATAFYRGYEPSADFQRLWELVFALLLAIWVDADSRDRPEVDQPSFDVGLFVCLIWIVYLPWYLLRTRGSKGWLWIGGLCALVFLGTILQWLIYAAT